MGYRRREVVSPRRGFAGDEAEGGGGSGERVGRNREEVVWGAEWEERVPRVLLREREGRPGALQRARHRDGELAAAGLGGGAWQSKERHSAMAKGSGEFLGDAWKPARSRRWPGGGPERRAARRSAQRR